MKVKALGIYILLVVSCLGETLEATNTTTLVGASLFGSPEGNTNRFTCTFYDLKRDRRGSARSMNLDGFRNALTEFLSSGWSFSRLAQYYRAPQKLHTSHIMIPPQWALYAPMAYGEEASGGWCWALHYKGKLVYKKDITFRFRGSADDLMLVKVDGKVVLGDSIDDFGGDWSNIIPPIWNSEQPESKKQMLGNNLDSIGDWIPLKAGVPVDMEVLAAEGPGGWFSAMLLVEEKGVEYRKDSNGRSLFPIFKTEEPSIGVQHAMLRSMAENEADLSGGPVFGFPIEEEGAGAEQKAAETPPEAACNARGFRIWTGDAGQVIEARLIKLIGKTVILQRAQGGKCKVPLNRLSRDDQTYVDLFQRARFSVLFSESSVLKRMVSSPFFPTHSNVVDHDFCARITQQQPCNQPHPLSFEFYVVARELKGDNYILLARKTDAVDSSIDIKQKNLLVMTIDKKSVFDEQLCGEPRENNDFLYLLVITDKQGRVVHHTASEEWLFQYLEHLRTIPEGCYMDKTCTLTPPTPVER